MRIIVLDNRANASRPGMLQLRPDDIRAPNSLLREAMLSENSDADRTSMANVSSRQKNKRLAAARSGENLRHFLALRPCFRSCRADLKLACLSRDALRNDTTKVNAQARFGETGKCRSSEYAAQHSFPGTTTRRVLCFQPHHSKPRAFIAQIAAMKTAFVAE